MNNQTIDLKKEVELAKKRDKRNKIIFKVIIYILLTLVAITTLFPFIVMICYSFMDESQYLSIKSIFDMIPKHASFKNYATTLTYEVMYSLEPFNFVVAFFNTVIVGLVTTVVGLIFTILAAFAFAKLNFKGKNVIFMLLLATMMIPAEMFTISNYRLIDNMGLRQTLPALILPFLVNVYYIFLLRNTFMTVPKELYKAAKIDGVSDFKFLLKVMIPLAMPTLITISILKFIGVWNSYIWPNLINGGSSAQLISNWMMNSGIVDSDNGIIYYTVRMSGAVIVTIPLLIVFLIFRKYIMRGMSKSGIKG